MIHLEVEPYCENCPDFRPELETSELDKYEMTSRDVVKYYDHAVRCVHAERCRHIVEVFKKEILKNERMSIDDNNTKKENPIEIIIDPLSPNEKRTFINSLKESVKGIAKKINYISSETHDISGVSIDGICNLYFCSDEEAVKGRTVDYALLSKSYNMAVYLRTRGTKLLNSFDELINVVIEKLEEKKE